MRIAARESRLALVGTVFSLALIALILLGTSSTASAAGTADRPPVVVIVLDEFPTAALINHQGDISAGRFPNLARLAREASWYPNHTTVARMTFRAVPAILTGNRPSDRPVFPVVSQYSPNLFARLSAAGYGVTADEIATQICPRSICKQRPESRLNPAAFNGPNPFIQERVARTWRKFKGGVMKHARTFKIRPGRLVFRHLLLPHHPYMMLPSGQTYPPGPIAPTPAGRPFNRAPIGNARLGYQRMMIQAGYVDRIIGAIRTNAIRQGRWKSMMLVVVADHGVEHRPQRYWRVVKPNNVGSIAFAPLFVKYPGSLRGGKSDLATQGIDVVPTITRALGLADFRVDGVPIQDLPDKPRPVRVDRSTFPFARSLASRNQAIRYRNNLLGNGGLYRMGLATHLIGRRVSGTDLPRANARIDNAARYTNLNPRARNVPALISGTVRGIATGDVVAVSVNGIIRGTAQVFRAGRRVRFGVMVNPEQFGRSNRIGVYRVNQSSR